MSAWLLFATGELLYWDLDQMTSLDAIEAAAGRFGTAALLELVAAVLLLPAIMTLVLLTRSHAPRLAAVGGTLAAIGAVGTGAFAQFHLVVLAMTDGGLDRGAMEVFLNTTLQEGGGLWTIPIMFVLLALPIGLLLLAVAGARSGITSRWSAWLIGAYLVLHLGVGGEWVEVGAHFGLAAVLAWIGVGVWRARELVPTAPTPAPRRVVVPAAMMAVMVLLVSATGAVAQPDRGANSWVIEATCGSEPIQLLAVSGGTRIWDLSSVNHGYVVKQIDQTMYHEDGSTTTYTMYRGNKNGLGDAFVCGTGIIHLQGFVVEFDLTLVVVR
jgi:hypothetical protein